jgi:hypothetical protein
MQGIRPQNLTNAELLRYAYIIGHDKLPLEWVQEIITRFANLLDDGK